MNFRLEISLKKDDATGEYLYYVIEETGPEETDTRYIVFGSTTEPAEAHAEIRRGVKEVIDL